MAASKVNRRSMASFNYWQAPQGKHRKLLLRFIQLFNVVLKAH
jgi:hypothetical protein